MVPKLQKDESLVRGKIVARVRFHDHDQLERYKGQGTDNTNNLHQEKGQQYMMDQNQIHFRAEFTIRQGKIEEYKKLIRDLSKIVEADEPDTITYQFYLNTSGTKCIVHETYTNSEAAFAHMAGVASQEILPKIFNIAKISRFDVYGKPSKELQSVLAGFNVEDIYNLYAGFSR